MGAGRNCASTRSSLRRRRGERRAVVAALVGTLLLAAGPAAADGWGDRGGRGGWQRPDEPTGTAQPVADDDAAAGDESAAADGAIAATPPAAPAQPVSTAAGEEPTGWRPHGRWHPADTLQAAPSRGSEQELEPADVAVAVDQPQAGPVQQITVTVANGGPGAAEAVEAVAIVSRFVTDMVTAGGDGWTCDTSSMDEAITTICTLDESLPGGEEATITITVEPFNDGCQVGVQVGASSANPDSDASNNTSMSGDVCGAGGELTPDEPFTPPPGVGAGSGGETPNEPFAPPAALDAPTVASRPTLTVPPRQVVFLARVDDPVDAVLAGAVAVQVDGTVLLTPSGALGDAARDALTRHRPDLVVLVGGTTALSAAVEADVTALGLAVRRIGGATREETAALLADLATELTS